jgi:hypothetical protein
MANSQNTHSKQTTHDKLFRMHTANTSTRQTFQMTHGKYNVDVISVSHVATEVAANGTVMASLVFRVSHNKYGSRHSLSRAEDFFSGGSVHGFIKE